jgi:hypothetical protein
MTLWHGRLSGGTADVVMDYSVSLHFDQRLARDDIAGSRAHVRGLGRGGLLGADEVENQAQTSLVRLQSQARIPKSIPLLWAPVMRRTGPDVGATARRKSPVASCQRVPSA